MTGRLSDETLFRTLMKDFRELFKLRTSEHQESVTNAISRYLETVQQNFELVRSENAIRESEQDPGFRDRVAEAVQAGWETSEVFRDAIDH